MSVTLRLASAYYYNDFLEKYNNQIWLYIYIFNNVVKKKEEEEREREKRFLSYFIFKICNIIIYFYF